MKQSRVCLIVFMFISFLSTGVYAADWSSMISGTTNNINGVWGSSGSDVFAVGHAGTILHYDGTAWSPMSSPTGNNLNSIWGRNATHVFAVGDNGTILHYDGTAWSAVASPTPNNLNCVWGYADNYAYAVGDEGTLLYYTGDWALPMPPGTFTVNLNSIWGLSGSDIFAVGDSGTIAHFGGTPPGGFMDSGTTENLYDVWGSSSNTIFAVGTHGTFLVYSGISWSAPMAGVFTSTFNAIWGSSGSDIFAVGDGGVITHYGGSPPGSYMDSGTTQNLYAIWGSSGADVFAVGANGTILHYNRLADYSCEGRCGFQAPAGCGCDEACHAAGDCCPDKCTLCSSPLCGECQLHMSPEITNVSILGMVQFNATVDGTCHDPCFTWDISLQESTGSTINQNGLYTAGGNAGTDIVHVADPCNGNISAAAIVDVIISTTTTIPITTTTTTAPPDTPDKYKDKYNFRGAGADMNMYDCSGCVCSSVYFAVSESIQKDSPGAPVRYGPSGHLYVDSYNDCTGGYRYGDAEIELSAFDISKQLDSAYAEGSGTIYGWGREDYDDTTGRPFTESVNIQVAWTGIGDLYSGRYRYSENYNYPGFSIRYSYQGSGSSRDAQATGSILIETDAMGIVSDYASIMQNTERFMGVAKYSKDGLYRSQNYCEGNFDGDQDVDGNDATTFKSDFGRSTFNNPCPQF